LIKRLRLELGGAAERPFDRLRVALSIVEGRARAGVGPREH
jgi:hypothetical protein